MNIIDIIILLCCVPAVFRGLSKGFVEQLAATAALVLGAWMSFKFTKVVTEWIKPYIDLSEGILQVIAFALILIVVFIVLTLAGKLLEGLLKLVLLGWLNKLLGVVFALLKTALIIGLVVILVNSVITELNLETPKVLAESVLYEPIRDFSCKAFPYLKEWVGSI